MSWLVGINYSLTTHTVSAPWLELENEVNFCLQIYSSYRNEKQCRKCNCTRKTVCILTSKSTKLNPTILHSRYNLLPIIKLDVTGVDSISSQKVLKRCFDATSLIRGWKRASTQEVFVFTASCVLSLFPRLVLGGEH